MNCVFQESLGATRSSAVTFSVSYTSSGLRRAWKTLWENCAGGGENSLEKD
jgi:hypothetical protein